ncbi:hypothetical protein, variant [Phytophthora nicotianae P1976]|uniref:Uncharacterized protein n=1 Tax=Phytophthora nicotianae P1976 TaxID=1317066 RepID=A0A081ALZ1_PHYNI|nr:hypothetical protein, variant [Phytophthora nicotianae P1976]
MSASWDSDLSSIIEKTNNNLKLLRKIGDKPQVRSPDVSVTAAGHPSARPRAFVGAQDDAGSTSSRGSARPRAFIRGDDDTSSMGSHGSARPKAYVRGDDDTGSMGSHTSGRPKAFIRTDDDSGSVSSRASARPKAFIRPDDDAGSASSRASARPKAFIRADDDSGSVSSRASARPKAFIRGDDDTGSMSSRSSARPKAFVRGDDDTGSMNSNQGLGRSRLDSGSSSGRPHVGIAGGGGLTAAMLQQHRATAAGGTGLGMADLNAQRSRFDLDETRSMSGVSASRLRRPLGANGRVPHARPLGASMGPRIRVPDADIPSDIPNHVVDEIKKSLETHFASRNGAVDKKVADLRTDVAGLTTQTSSLSSQISELRDAVLVSANSASSANAPAISDPKIFASVQANAAAIARLEEHSADLLGRKVSVDRELAELGSRVKSMSSATMKISTLEDNIEALVANRQKQEQGLFKLADRVQLMHRQMGSLVDMKAVENLLSIRLTREFREMEDRLAQNVMRMAEKMEQKVQSMEKQSFSQRQESLAALKNDLTDDIQRLQSSALRKSDLVPLQNAQTQSKEDLAQLSSALDRQEKKLQDAKVANSTLRDELADARTELNKALQSQQRSASALLEEKLEQITTKNKEKSTKFDDQLSELAKKQKKLEEATKTLQETMTQVKAEAGQRWSRSSADREEENDKLRQRLARSVAELEALATTKADVERRFASEEQQFQARLNELRTTLTETEKQKEAQRLELMQKLQEESKLMGVAQGKNSLLETLLAREKAENEEKNELVRKSKKEVTEVREQIRNLESEKEKKVRQLTSELQAKQTQVGLLTKTLKRIETASAKMLDLSKREAKTVRRVKATKEHELFIAQLKLKEMERVAQALQNGDEMKKQAALTAASTEERKELEKLLLESQLEKDELKQELEEMTEEFNAAKESQKVIMEDTITKLSSDYDEKISDLKQQISDKEQAMRQLRDTLVEKSNLDALEDELAALKDEKNDLLEQIQRAQIEHERVTLKTETNLRLEHATEFAAMKSKYEERISELEAAKTELETTKATIAELEKSLEEQEALHQREVSTLTTEIKEARAKIDECTAQILDLEETKTRLEGEVSQMEANIGGASAEKEEELEAIKSQMQAEVEKLRAELAEVSSALEEKQTQLKEAKQSDEANRQRLVEMAMAQEEMQSRYVAQIDSLTLKLNQERESSRAREQDLEDTIDKLNADVKMLKTESSKELEAARAELTDQMTELTTTLKASQHREQQLQSRLKRILEELVQAANASGENEVAEDTEMSDDEAITHHLDTLYATHRRTAHELERLQAEYELTVKQAAADSATAQELDNQVKEHVTQIKELESVVEQLREELKEQYHKSAIIAKGSDEFSEEMASLREEKRQLERQLQEEEKDREKREVSYQRKTEMKEREVEELRNENKTLTAAVAAVREKIRAVENVKYNDLGELQKQLKDLEERTAALQPDEKNVANLEQSFTATRQEIVTLTAEVQSLYQKLTACCGIMEWSELRASVFDEEEKLSRVRSENARELAKVQSVEQEVLTNAEFLNALLVAHGSTGGDEDLLNDFRWMQKYASIAPEIVEKLRKVESRLRDAVLDLPDGPNTQAARPPNSQRSAVDGAAIAQALEKAREDYFSETSDAADEDKLDVDQPDVEQEGLVDQEEGASHDSVDVDEQSSIGAMSHEESGTCADELGVAEHVVHDEQERSREEQLDEELSVKQDRNDDDVDGLESETPKIQAKGFSGGGGEGGMDEVERLMLERSSKQVNPRIDNECDDSDEFATTNVHETEEQSAAVTDEYDSNTEFVEQAELSAVEGNELDPLEESSFDNAMISALESRESSYSTLSTHAVKANEVEADLSDSESHVVPDAIAESSFEDSNDEARDTCDPVADNASVELTPAAHNSDGDAISGGEVSLESTNKPEVVANVKDTTLPSEQPSSGTLSSYQAEVRSDEKLDQLESNELGESSESTTACTAGVGNALKESVTSVANNELENSDDEENTLEGSLRRVRRVVIEQEEDNELSSTLRRPTLADSDEEEHCLEESVENVESHSLHKDNGLEESTVTLDRSALVEENELEQSAPSIVSDEINALEESTSSRQSNEDKALNDIIPRMNKVEIKQLDASNSLEESSASMNEDTAADNLHTYETSVLEESSSNVDNTAEIHEDGEDSVLEESSSSLASELQRNNSENCPDRASSRQTYDDSLAVQSDDDDNPSDRGAVVNSPLDNSFDTDIQPHIDDEADIRREAEPIKHQEDEDECSEEQLRAAEYSLDRQSAPESYDEDAGIIESTPAPAMAHRTEDDDSSEEETIPVQTQPTTAVTLSRFGMRARHLHLEEDDETDAVERLLLNQNASIMQNTQQQYDRSTRPSATNDDDEFGESSLQSRGDDHEEIGEDSIWSREGPDKCEDKLTRSRDSATDEQAINNKESLDTLADEYKDGHTSETMSSTMRRAVAEEKSLEDSATSLKNTEAKFILDDNELGQSAASSASGDHAEDLEDSTSSMRSFSQRDGDNHLDDRNAADDVHTYRTDALDDPLEESEGSVEKVGPIEPLDEGGALEYFSSSLGNSAFGYEGGDGSAFEESSSTSLTSEKSDDDRASSRRRHELQSDVANDHGAVVISRPNQLESSFDADVQSVSDDEASSEVSIQPVKRQEGEDKWSQEQAEHSLHRPIVREGDRDADVRTSTMTFLLEKDDSSEEETMPVQTQPTTAASLSRFGMATSHLHLEEDDEMDDIERLLLDQSASSMQKSHRQSGRSTRPAAADDEFKGSSLHSPGDNNDEFGEDSFRSRKGTDEFEGRLSRSGDNEFDEQLVLDKESSIGVKRNTLVDEDVEDNTAGVFSSTMRRTASENVADDDNSLKESPSSLKNVETNEDNELEQSVRSASGDHAENLEESTSSMRSITQRDEESELDKQLDAHNAAGGVHTNTLDHSLNESEANEERDGSMEPFDEAGALEHSTSSMDNTAVEYEGDDDSVLEESSSSLVSSKHAHNELQSGEDDDHHPVVISRPNPFESSFDADMQSDFDDEASSEISTQPVKHQEGGKEEKSEEQLRVGRPVLAEDDHDADEDESSEDEAMPVQAPILSASLGRFGMATRRLHLEEDDEMDDIEGLLLDQSASSMQQRRQQPGRFAKETTTDDDEFDENTIRSREDEENSLDESATLKNVDTRSLHEDTLALDTFAILNRDTLAEEEEQSAASITSGDRLEDSNAFEDSTPSNTAEAYQYDEGSALEESSSSRSRETYNENLTHRASSGRHTHDEFLAPQNGDDSRADQAAAVSSQPNVLESSFDADMQSDSDEEVAERSMGDDHDTEDTVESASTKPMSLRMEEDESSDEETMPVQTQPVLSTRLSRFGMSTRRLNLEESDEMDEIERLLLDQSASSLEKRQQQSSRFPRSTAMDDDDEFGESSLQSRGDDDNEFGENSIRSREDPNEFEDESAASSSLDNNRSNQIDEAQRQQAHRFTRRTRHHGTDEEDEFGASSIRSRAHHDEFVETTKSQEEDEFGEASIRSRSCEEDEFGEVSLTSREGMPIQMSNDSRLPEEGRFGSSSRSDVRETNDLSQALSSLRGDPDLVSAYPREENEDGSREEEEFGETSFHSGSYEDDDFGEISIPLQEDTGIPPAPSRLLSAPVVGRADRGLVYHDGLMNSPLKSPRTTTTGAHDDSTNEAEHDYMDDSFDLDESLEEEDDERDV